MPIILYNLSQTTFIELLHIKKDKQKIQSMDEKRIKELLDINKGGYDVFPDFLKFCIENISNQMDSFLSQDSKNKNNDNSTNNTNLSTGNNNNVDTSNSLEFPDTHLNEIQQLQINNIGFDLNLNMDKTSLMFNKSKLKIFQLISTIHLARIAWLIYSGAIKPSTSKESNNDWHAESNYWIRQQMILLAGCEDILINIHDRNHSLVRRGLDEFKFMNPENYNNMASVNITWPWKIEYFDEQFLEKCFTEHCKNFLKNYGDVSLCPKVNSLVDDNFADEANVQEKINQELNKKRILEKKLGLRINTYQELETIINKNTGSLSEKPLNESKDEDEIEEYLKNALLYSQLNNGKKIYVSVPDKVYIPADVASGYLYLSILFLLDSVSKTEAYRNINRSNQLIRILLKYSHSIYSYLCFNICPHCLSQFWSFKPEITTPLSPVDETRSYGLKNKKSIEEKLIESSKNNPSSVVSPLAYYLNDFDHDFEDDADTNFVNFYDNVKTNNKSAKKSYNINTGFPKVMLLKSQPPQKTSRNSSLFAHKSNKDPSKIAKYNSSIIDKKDGSLNLAEDLFLKKLANLDKEKENLKPSNDIQNDYSNIKISNSNNNNENNNNNNNNNNNDSTNNNNSNNSNNNDTKADQSILQDDPSVMINDESFSLDSYYNISNTSQENIHENINLDKYFDIYGNNENNKENLNKEDSKKENGKDKKKNISILIEKQIDDHISSITNADSSEQDVNDASLIVQTDDKSDLSSQIDDHIENTEKQFQSPYISTSQLEKSFMIISQSLDLTEDFEKGNFDCENKSSEQNDTNNYKIKDDNTNSNTNNYNNNKPENQVLNATNESRVITKEEYMKEQFHKKMWDVWEKYLSGDPINKNRELIRFPCIHNQT
ncbi:hypothetical protein PIROE2DRAFT_60662 [Piromyces sp. E2]|nr:hypothetical protein PIROE2DRAFT_60662 [Piromyces sp. E2]|eukprot:OUM64460.1 hypothetical protein PIROE2DRAFT_60662 [Piromyces sp. E2]